MVYNDTFVEDNITVAFNTSNWLSINLLSGDPVQLSSGLSAIYTVDVSTNSLNEGAYHAYILNNTNTVKKSRSQLDSLTEGINYIKKEKGLATLLLVTILNNIFIMGPATLGLAVFVKETLMQDFSILLTSQIRK